MSGRLADAILVGRDLLKHYPGVLAKRLERHPQLAGSCSHPEAGVPVFENLGAGSASVETAVRDYASAVAGSRFEVRITHVPAKVAAIAVGEDGNVRSPDRIIRSILLRYPKRCDIMLVDNLNACWKRFALCKEFAHLVMEEGQGNKAVSVTQQIAHAMDIARSPDPTADLSSEAFAWFAAVEMLLPFSDRSNFMARHGAGEDHLTLARSYWVPRAIIDLFFDSAFHQVSNEIR